MDDFAGNPLQWKGNVLQWSRGRRLTCYGDSSYTYDAGGIRQSKTVGSETHTYYTEDSRIHKEEFRGRKLLYGYDESGIATIECNGQIYYMQKNIQGDIVGLVDGTKKVVAKYVYDAWGNHKVYDATNNEDTNANFIGNINPFRYRGYYYDGETGLYYLQTRYYDPSIGRFLSADSIDYADPESFNGFNLYSYCGNNPVMYTDPTGHAWWDTLFKVIGWIALAAATVALTVVTCGAGSATAVGLATVAFSTTLGGVIGGYANESVGGSFMSGWIGGSFNGLVQSSAALAFPGAGKFIGAFLGGFTGSALTQAIDNFVPNGTRRSMAEVFTSSLIAGGISTLYASFSKGVNYGINDAVRNGVAIGGRVITEKFGNAMSVFFDTIFDIIASFFNM